MAANPTTAAKATPALLTVIIDAVAVDPPAAGVVATGALGLVTELVPFPPPGAPVPGAGVPGAPVAGGMVEHWMNTANGAILASPSLI
jgi:hypothetical protein